MHSPENVSVSNATVTFYVCISSLTLKLRPVSLCLSVRSISREIEGVKKFSFVEMSDATNGFDSSAVIGRGSYGKVYKGILPNKTVVAIKRGEETSLQSEKEFLNEIDLLSRLHHRNLVSLVGYSSDIGEQVRPFSYELSCSALFLCFSTYPYTCVVCLMHRCWYMSICLMAMCVIGFQVRNIPPSSSFILSRLRFMLPV